MRVDPNFSRAILNFQGEDLNLEVIFNVRNYNRHFSDGTHILILRLTFNFELDF